jgi:hypothetical protein
MCPRSHDGVAFGNTTNECNSVPSAKAAYRFSVFHCKKEMKCTISDWSNYSPHLSCSYINHYLGNQRKQWGHVRQETLNEKVCKYSCVLLYSSA